MRCGPVLLDANVLFSQAANGSLTVPISELQASRVRVERGPSTVSAFLGFGPSQGLVTVAVLACSTGLRRIR